MRRHNAIIYTIEHKKYSNRKTNDLEILVKISVQFPGWNIFVFYQMNTCFHNGREDYLIDFHQIAQQTY